MIKANHLLNICKGNKAIANSDSAKDLAERYASYLSTVIKYGGDGYDLWSIKPCVFDLEQYKEKVATIVRHDDWDGDPMDKWEVVVHDMMNGKRGLTYKDSTLIAKIFDVISTFEGLSNFVSRDLEETA